MPPCCKLFPHCSPCCVLLWFFVLLHCSTLSSSSTCSEPNPTKCTVISTNSRELFERCLRQRARVHLLDNSNATLEPKIYGRDGRFQVFRRICTFLNFRSCQWFVSEEKRNTWDGRPFRDLGFPSTFYRSIVPTGSRMRVYCSRFASLYPCPATPSH